MVAENDYGLGQIVDLISHSEHVALVGDLRDRGRLAGRRRPRRCPPYAGGGLQPLRQARAVISTRYDMLSMIRSMELILGMRPLGLPDAVATPMYDAFQPTPSTRRPTTSLAPTYPLLERNANTAANRALSRGRDFVHPRPGPARRVRQGAVVLGARHRLPAAAARSGRDARTMKRPLLSPPASGRSVPRSQSAPSPRPPRSVATRSRPSSRTLLGVRRSTVCGRRPSDCQMWANPAQWA